MATILDCTPVLARYGTSEAMCFNSDTWVLTIKYVCCATAASGPVPKLKVALASHRLTLSQLRVAGWWLALDLRTVDSPQVRDVFASVPSLCRLSLPIQTVFLSRIVAIMSLPGASRLVRPPTPSSSQHESTPGTLSTFPQGITILMHL